MPRVIKCVMIDMINTGTTSCEASFFKFFLLYIYKMTMVWYLLCDHVRNDRFVCCCFFCLVTEMAEEVLYPLRARLTSLCSGWNGELPSCQLMIILLPVLFIFWSLSVTVNSWWHSLNNQSMVQTNSSILVQCICVIMHHDLLIYTALFTSLLLLWHWKFAAYK